MRSAPILLVVLLCAVGVGLGLRVMLRAPTRSHGAGGGPIAGSAGAWPDTIAGVPQGGIYTGIAEEPGNVNPFTCAGNVARRYVLGFTHDCLLDSDPTTGELRGALASAFETAADGSSCVFTLRDGVQFADGSPLTMRDVLFGWELAVAGHLSFGFAGDAFARVASVTQLDDRRFRVVFRQRHFAAVQAVGESWLVGQRQFFVDRVAAKARIAGTEPPEVASPRFAELLAQIERECGPGTGPYVLTNPPEGPSMWRMRKDLTLVRNERSWRRANEPGTWNFAGSRLLFRDPSAVLGVLKNREVDWFSSPDVGALVRDDASLLTDYRELAYDYRTLGVFLIKWNCRRTPLDLPEVRRALAKLFDMTAIQKSFGSNCTTAKAFAKPDSADYPGEVETPAFDPSQARRELREAGFDPERGNPLRLSILAPLGLPAMRATLELFVDAAKQAGVEVRFRMPEWGTYLDEKVGGEWDGLFVQQSFRPWADPYEFVHSGGMDNDGGWSHPGADRLAEDIRTEPDRQRRVELLRELHLLVHREQPVAFLVHPRVTMLLGVDVKGAVPGPLGLTLERAFFAADSRRRGG